MQQPDPMNIQIERLVDPGDIKPDSYSGSGVLILAPWEFGLVPVAGREEAYSAHWVCPRCLDTGFLGHQITIEGHGMRFTCRSDEDRDERDYIQISDEHLDLISDAGDLQVTVDPSIGCTTCGFHCYLEANEYRVLSDWQGADDDRDPAAIFGNRVSKLHDNRPDAYQRLAEIVEGGT